MSYSAIENLVEDSARAVLSSDIELKKKQQLIQSLYNFQDKFDTGDTYDRLANEYKKLKIDPKKRDLAVEDCLIWIVDLLTVFIESKQTHLIQEFRYALANIIFEEGLGIIKEKTLEEYSKDKTLLNLRTLLEKNKHNLRSKPKHFEKLSLKELSTAPSVKPNEAYVYTLLLDLKSDLKTINLNFVNDSLLVQNNANTIDFLPPLVEKNLGFKLIDKVETKFYFGTEDNDGYYSLKNLEYKIEIDHFQNQCLIPKFIFRFKKLMPWSSFNKNNTFHQSISLNSLIPSDISNKNRMLDKWGGWKFSNKNDLKKLEKIVLDIKDNLQYLENYIRFYEDHSLDSLIEKYTLDQALKVCEKIQNSTTIQYNPREPFTFFEIDLFSTRSVILMLFASFKVANQEKADTELQLLEQEILKMNDRAASKVKYLETFRELQSKPRILFYKI